MAQKCFRHVTHCIFDMDGLLLDTEKLYTQVMTSIVESYGKTFSFAVKVSVMGLQTRPMAEHLVAAYELPITWEEYARQQAEGTQKLMMDAELMPDSEPIYEKIVANIIRTTVNKAYPMEVRLKVLGTTEQRAAATVIKEMDLPISHEQYMSLFTKMCHEWLHESQVMKGAERLLRHLSANNIPFCLATSSGENMVEIKTTHHKELFKLFHHRVCGSTDPEVKEGKPAPDIFLVAASRFPDKPCPSQCLVFEDAPNGVTAATTAGMQCVMVPDERVPEEMRSKATQVLRSLQDFKPEDFGLPPFPQ